MDGVKNKKNAHFAAGLNLASEKKKKNAKGVTQTRRTVTRSEVK
jgi:hypothetical protein